MENCNDHLYPCQASIDDNDALSYYTISGSLHKIKEAGSSTTISLYTSMNAAYSRRNNVLVQYDGSLTTPDCNESVLWNVLSDIEPISYSQVVLNSYKNRFLKYRNFQIDSAHFNPATRVQELEGQ